MLGVEILASVKAVAKALLQQGEISMLALSLSQPWLLCMLGFGFLGFVSLFSVRFLYANSCQRGGRDGSQ